METITGYMQRDHDEIDAILERARAAARVGDAATLAREAHEFAERLERHIEMEERLLFPAFEERTGMTSAGPSVQMREEHVRMKEIFRQLRSTATARDAAGFQRAAQALVEVLAPHNAKEEQMMYPMLDDAMGADADSLLSDVKAMVA